MTNFERIKQMTPEEIAELLQQTTCNYCLFLTPAGRCVGENQACFPGVLLWLNAEAEAEDD